MSAGLWTGSATAAARVSWNGGGIRSSTLQHSKRQHWPASSGLLPVGGCGHHDAAAHVQQEANDQGAAHACGSRKAQQCSMRLRRRQQTAAEAQLLVRW